LNSKALGTEYDPKAYTNKNFNQYPLLNRHLFPEESKKACAYSNEKPAYNSESSKCIRLEIKNPVIAANGPVVRVKGNRYFPEVSGELSRRGTDQSGSRPAARDHPIVTKEY
jgi:hypothetical protein